MAFNTDMPFQESTVMSVDLVCECPPDDTSCAPAALDERAAAPIRARRNVVPNALTAAAAAFVSAMRWTR